MSFYFILRINQNSNSCMGCPSESKTQWNKIDKSSELGVGALQSLPSVACLCKQDYVLREIDSGENSLGTGASIVEFQEGVKQGHEIISWKGWSSFVLETDQVPNKLSRERNEALCLVKKRQMICGQPTPRVSGVKFMCIFLLHQS